MSPHSRHASRCGARSSAPSPATTSPPLRRNSDLCERAAAHCVDAGYRIAQAERATRVVLGRPPAYYDRARLDAAEHLLVRDAEQLAANRPRLVQLCAIAAVNAARCREWSQARARVVRALRRRQVCDLVRLIVTLTPPLARRLWADGGRRARRTAPTTVSRRQRVRVTTVGNRET